MKKILLTENTWWIAAIILIVLVYFVGLFVPIFEFDAACYAEISREMFTSGRYTDIILKGKDWLDKPHFQFWITALSFSIFGLNVIAFKIPAIICILLGAYYTYLFGVRYYDKKTGLIAALILLSAQHIITSNMDVRAEPYLTAFTIIALYHIALYLDLKSKLHLVISAISLAILLMTKGLYTVIPVASAIGCTLLLKKQWKELFNIQWLWYVLLVLLFTSPTLYSYYLQFDQHPEKLIFNKHHVSGIRFFLIDSQWGRFVNKGPITGSGDPFFFVHTLLWAFLPWGFVAYYALYHKIAGIFKKSTTTETYTLFSFVCMFLIFSASKFQLPYYINSIFAPLAILCAAALQQASKKAIQILFTFQAVTVLLLLLLMGGIIYFYHDTPALHVDTIIIFILSLLFAASTLIQKNTSIIARTIYFPVFISLMVNYYMNRDFYPSISKYQSESAVADFIIQQKLPVDKLIAYDSYECVTSFTLNKVIPELEFEKVTPTNTLFKNKLVFTSNRGMGVIDSLKLKYVVLKKFDDFHVTMLTPEFINQSTRRETLSSSYLLEVTE